MNKLEFEKVLIYIKKFKEMSIATYFNGIIDNATVSFIFIDNNIYFGSFENTLKTFNISNNPRIAVVINAVQIHGNCFKVLKHSDEYNFILKKYLKKFPYYKSFFDYNENTFYKINIQILWKYNYKENLIERQSIVFDKKYADILPILKIKKTINKSNKQYSLLNIQEKK